MSKHVDNLEKPDFKSIFAVDLRVTSIYKYTNSWQNKRQLISAHPVDAKNQSGSVVVLRVENGEHASRKL